MQLFLSEGKRGLRSSPQEPTIIPKNSKAGNSQNPQQLQTPVKCQIGSWAVSHSNLIISVRGAEAQAHMHWQEGEEKGGKEGRHLGDSLVGHEFLLDPAHKHMHRAVLHELAGNGFHLTRPCG